MNNPTNLFDIIPAHKVGAPPLVIRAQVTNSNAGLVEGVPATSQKLEYYVLVSALPEDLRRRITLAVQAIQSAM